MTLWRIDVMQIAAKIEREGERWVPVVGVASGAVPVTLDGLGVQGQDHSCDFCDTLQDVPGSPQLVGRCDTLRGADLELPLSGHHFSVDSADLDASVQAGLVMSVHNVTAPCLVGSGPAVVWALGAWVSSHGPS